MMKKWKATRGKLQFSIFLKIFAPLEAKMMKRDKKMIKKWKKLEENCNFPFFGQFLHHWKQKWWKLIKHDKKMKKLKENYNFAFFGKFWHHWKQKWWNMTKKW